jgi:hypothetical protein
MYKITLLLFIGLMAFVGCKKNDIITPKTTYSIVFDNDYNILQGQFAAFLTNADGSIAAFRWLKGSDTTQLTVQFSEPETYHCTVVKMTIQETTAGRDTTLELNTYQDLANNTHINLRNLSYKRTTDYRIQFKNISSLDTIIVPDGLTFVKPQASNNFFGHFKIQHTGDFWLRVRINGDPHWRYMIYNNFTGTELTAELDPNILPKMADNPPVIGLPFLSTWKYSLQGLLDLENNRLLPIGDLDRAPGGSIPVLNKLTVFQPDNQIFSGYRINLRGYNGSSGGYTYYYDRIFDQIPLEVPEPGFDIQQSTLNDTRLIAVVCTGQFDDLVVTRSNLTSPFITWTVTTASAISGGTVKMRLSDVPAALTSVFPSLGDYSFADKTLVRAENYDFLNGVEEVYAKIFSSTDPFWQAKAQMMGIERQF